MPAEITTELYKGPSYLFFFPSKPPKRKKEATAVASSVIFEFAAAIRRERNIPRASFFCSSEDQFSQTKKKKMK
jgi:hypothetical protein